MSILKGRTSGEVMHKLVIVGPDRVGKTSLLLTALHGEYPPKVLLHLREGADLHRCLLYL